MYCERCSDDNEEIGLMEGQDGRAEFLGELLCAEVNIKAGKTRYLVLTDSPKNTISGLTSPPHFLLSHLGISPLSTALFIFPESKGVLQSIHLCDAKLPWASMILSSGTPARRSRVSMFCVKQVCRREWVLRREMNVCVRVGVKRPG